jgi:two-component system chemotaxis sensor kinase CheA
MAIDISRFRETFFEEAAEHLGSLENGLLELQSAGGDRELLNAIFRAAHSIKGGAGSFGLDEMARFTHSMEGVLDRLREGALTVTPELVTLLLSAVDVLQSLLAASRAGNASEVPMDDVLGALGRVLNGGAAAPGAATPAAAAGAVTCSPHDRVFQVRFAPKPGFFFGGQDPLLLLRDLSETGEMLDVTCDTAGLPALADLDPEKCHLAWTLRLKVQHTDQGIRDVFMFVDDACDLGITEEQVPITVHHVGPDAAAPHAPAAAGAERRPGAERRAGATPEASSIRVATDKVDKLVDLLGELVIAQAMVAQIIEHYTPERHGDLEGAMAFLDRNTRELQERVMGIRMLPVSTVFSRFPRLVHDLSNSFGKDVRLEVVGGDIELDKGVIERLSDPLTHLIRNSVDHGVETPAERERQGKPGQGVIALRALHEGGNVILEVEDDGKGLDLARIKAKGIAQGLLRPEDSPTDEQLHALIFEAGFSTAQVVTDVSGRGVGMDVVRRNVEQLNGTVTVDSKPGKGTRFRVRLPLTLAILDGLSVQVDGQTYVIPLLSVVESLRPRPGDVRTVLGRGEVLVVRGETLHLARMTRVFAVDGVEDPEQGIIVVLEGATGRFGVLVDDVLGQCQVVVKNLEAHYRKVEGVMGATIMGDGRVALIVDVQGLSSLAMRNDRPDAVRPAVQERAAAMADAVAV